jgi:hypothetical protein
MKIDKIEYEFIKDCEFKSYYANGIWITNTPKGETEIFFTMDKNKLPQATVHNVSDNGAILEEIERKVTTGIIEKHLLCSITLSEQNARDIFSFLKNLLGGHEENVQ